VVFPSTDRIFLDRSVQDAGCIVGYKHQLSTDQSIKKGLNDTCSTDQDLFYPFMMKEAKKKVA
jgi:hypothetical protein